MSQAHQIYPCLRLESAVSPRSAVSFCSGKYLVGAELIHLYMLYSSTHRTIPETFGVFEDWGVLGHISLVDGKTSGINDWMGVLDPHREASAYRGKNSRAVLCGWAGPGRGRVFQGPWLFLKHRDALGQWTASMDWEGPPRLRASARLEGSF